MQKPVFSSNGDGFLEYDPAQFAEEHRIVAKVEELMATCDALEVEVAKSRIETDRLMQTVLEEAFENKKMGTERKNLKSI